MGGLFPQRLLQWLGPLAVAGAVAALVAFAVIWSGRLNLAASGTDSKLSYDVLHDTFLRSVREQSKAIAIPAGYDAPAQVIKGAGQYARVCSHCHGAPGLGQNPVALSMRPRPQYLMAVLPQFGPRELFWIVKHGVEMSAMPAWPAQTRDDEVWAMVAFLQRAPKLTNAEFNALAYGDPAPPVLPATGVGPRGGGFKPVPYALHNSGEPPVNEFAYKRPAAGFGDDLQIMDPVQTCAQCHGADGGGRPGAPFANIAILDPAYFTAAMTAFANGTRHSGFMQPVAAQLSDAQIAALAAYFGKQPRRASGPVNATKAQLAQGSNIVANGAANGNVSACSSCHDLPPGLGTIGPPLAGQNEHYLREQIRLFRSGERKDPKQFNPMPAEAHQLTDAEIEAVALYFASQPPAPAAAPATAAKPTG